MPEPVQPASALGRWRVGKTYQDGEAVRDLEGEQNPWKDRLRGPGNSGYAIRTY